MDLTQVFSHLFRIDGLDIWEGLVHVGCNQEVYAEALRVFCSDLENKYSTLDGFLQKEKWKDYSATVHAIKGGLAGIGAWKLSQKVKELEDAAQMKDYKFCRENSGNVITSIGQFTSAIKSSALFAKEEIDREQVSLDYLRKMLNGLYVFCSSGNSVEADALVNELKTKTCSKETDAIVDMICAYVENLDYHLVLQTLAEQTIINIESIVNGSP